MNTCTSCGHQPEPGMLFCDKCGARFAQATTPPTQQHAQQNEQQHAQQNEQQLNLSPEEMFYRGSGYYEAYDYTNAEKWFLMAADGGDSTAQYNLGVMYQYGQGVPKDYDQALKWYSMAAAQGEEDARDNSNLINNIIGKAGRPKESSHKITVTRKKNWLSYDDAEDFCIDYGKSTQLLAGQSATVEVSTDIIFINMWCEAHRKKHKHAGLGKQLILKLTDKNVKLLFWYGGLKYKAEVTGAEILSDVDTAF